MINYKRKEQFYKIYLYGGVCIVMHIVKMKPILGFVVAAFVMLALPWVTGLLPSDVDMAYCFLLWYLVYPIFSVAIGLFSAKNRFWYLPIISAVLFLIGIGARFTLKEPLMFMYAFCYLLLGLLPYLSRKNK